MNSCCLLFHLPQVLEFHMSSVYPVICDFDKHHLEPYSFYELMMYDKPSQLFVCGWHDIETSEMCKQSV